jgi:AcrR family transcriptional regulator
MAKNEKMSRSQLRRQREREQRFTTILKAAETLFAEKGYHQTSMEQIADLAEVSVGTVYFYFKNKEDLLLKLMEKIGFHLRKMVGSAFRQADASLDGIHNAGMVFFREFCMKYPERLSIFFREATGQSARLEEQRKKQFGKLTDDLVDALQRVSDGAGIRYPSPISAELMAVSILGIYERVACHFLLWQDRSDDILTIAEDAVAFTLGGVTNLMTPGKANPSDAG